MAEKERGIADVGNRTRTISRRKDGDGWCNPDMLVTLSIFDFGIVYATVVIEVIE